MTKAQVVSGAGSAEPAAGPDRLHPTFITTWNCPYAQRTWIALNFKEIQFTPVFVDLKNKPEWFFKHNEYGRVPTLVWQEGTGNKSLYESLICNEYLADLPGPALLPEDPVDRARARLIIDQYGAKAGTAFGKLMFASEPGSAAADLAAALRWAEGEASAEGPYFLGKNFTLVDAAIIPFFIRLRLLEKLVAGFTMPEDLPKLQAWEAACLAHPAVSGTMQPPDSNKPYMDQMFETYQKYIAERKAAVTKQ